MIRLFIVLAAVFLLGAECPVYADETATSAAGGDASEFNETFDEFADEFEVGEPPEVRDPLQRCNRFMHRCNDRLYSWVVRPVSRGYSRIVPFQVRKSVQRCATNLEAPLRFVNCGLQGKFRETGRVAGRFAVNSTAGLLGLFDPAWSWLHMQPSDEDFGQTLGRYGVGAGWPLVLPFFGPSNVRDALCMIPDFLLKPTTYLEPIELTAGIFCLEEVNYVSLHLGAYESIKEDAMDPYTMMRDMYRSLREQRIKE